MATRLTRRTFLKGSIATGAAVAGGGLWTTAIQPRRTRAADTPIEHVVISMMENRSFDHYFGYAPKVQAAGFGPPAGYSQPNPGGSPDPVEPYRFFDLGTEDVAHDWRANSHNVMRGYRRFIGWLIRSTACTFGPIRTSSVFA